jgi:N-glycosylase/DNA lyase
MNVAFDSDRVAIELSSALHRCADCPETTWGEAWDIGSAAFWPYLAAGLGGRKHRLSDSFIGEVVACMLGGAGVPGDVGVAAFRAVDRSGLLTAEGMTPEAVAEVLHRPLDVPGRARPVRYRFWRQRSSRIAESVALLRSSHGDPDLDPRLAEDAAAMRERLLALPGVGMKTASWVVRNYLDSDEVAIIDIHVTRAGVAAGVFCRQWRLPADYALFESAFLSWAAVGGVRASVLDAVIWRTMADLREVGDVVVGQSRTSLSGTATSVARHLRRVKVLG